jgi:integrase
MSVPNRQGKNPRQKSNGRWVADFHLYGGKRVRRTFDKFEDAKSFLRKMREENKHRRGVATPRFLIHKAGLDFLETKSHLRVSSRKRYKATMVQFLDFCERGGIVFVDQFTPDHAAAFYDYITNERRDPTGRSERMVVAKPRTINRYIDLIKALFGREVSLRHIQWNPMAVVKRRLAPKIRPEYFHAHELEAFFRQEMSLPLREAFKGLLLTGMRFSELANLRWEDVDFEKRIVRVRSNGAFQTKTANAERSIPMADELYSLLSTMQSAPRSLTHPFCTMSGGLYRQANLLAACKRVARKAGIPGRAFLHKFRHTFATLLVQNGVSLENIKVLLGHSSIRETEIYAHHIPDHLHDQVGVLTRVIGHTLNPQPTVSLQQAKVQKCSQSENSEPLGGDQTSNRSSVQ